VVTLYPQHA